MVCAMRCEWYVRYVAVHLEYFRRKCKGTGSVEVPYDCCVRAPEPLFKNEGMMTTSPQKIGPLRVGG